MPSTHTQSHLSRRAFIKGAAVTGSGLVLPNWGGLAHARSAAQEATKNKKRCILLWMNGGASQIDTFDMKPEAPVEIRRDSELQSGRWINAPVAALTRRGAPGLGVTRADELATG